MDRPQVATLQHGSPPMQVHAPLAQGMVCAPQPYAVDAAVDVLARGGNAVDAAIAAGLVQGVVSPHMCGLGGYLVATVHPPGSSAPESVDAPALAGSGTTPDMWADRFESDRPHRLGLHPARSGQRLWLHVHLRARLGQGPGPHAPAVGLPALGGAVRTGRRLGGRRLAHDGPDGAGSGSAGRKRRAA